MPMSPKFFPDPAKAAPDGLVAVGGSVQPQKLLDAYRHGIFPWPMEGIDELLWWSPHPRAILPLDSFRASRRLLRRIRSGKFQITANQAFREVMLGCATGNGREEGTWILPEMIEGYTTLHALGHAHSVEVWRDDLLIGGVYGVAVGGLFAAESMFHRETDGSKIALFHLVQHLNERGYQLLDVQQWTAHTASLGVIEITRRQYLWRLSKVVDLPVTFGSLTNW